MNQNPSNPLGKKVEKILNTEIDPDTLNALKNVSILINDTNTIQTRRNLRANIEKQSLIINEQFVKQFSNVYEKFQKLQSTLFLIDHTCDKMIEKMNQLKDEQSNFIEKSEQIQSELNSLDENEKIYDEFSKNFLLTNDELSLINANDVKIDDNFFKLLDKIQLNQQKAKNILINNQLSLTGVELIEQMSKYNEILMAKLYHSIVNVLRTINFDYLELNSNLFISLKYLQTNHLLFKHCMDEYVIVRRSSITHSFIEALTRGNANSGQQAIELYSSDSVRYIRDMLSYLHQLFIFENDMLRTILKLCQHNNSEQFNRTIISSLSEGIIRILKIRIENCLTFNQDQSNSENYNNDSIQSTLKCVKNFFIIKNIINFYLNTFKQQLMLENCHFILFLNELLLSSDKICYNTLKFYCTKLDKQITMNYLEKQQPQLQQQKFVLNFQKILFYYIQLIQELFDNNNNNLMYFNEEEQKFETERILTIVIEQLNQIIIIISTKLLSSIDMTIFSLNCYEYLHQILIKYRFTESFSTNLKTKIDSFIDILVNEQYNHIINSLMIDSFCIIITNDKSTNSNDNLPLSSKNGCDSITIISFLNLFDKFLNNSKQFLMKQIDENIYYDQILQIIWKKSLQEIVKIYNEIYKNLIDPKNKYTDIMEHIKYRPEDVEKKILNF